jgi:hypothetical protein
VQPLQELYGAQGDARDPVAATVLMALIAGMSMNDGFQGLPAYHVSISQRDLAQRTGLSHKTVRNALQRLQTRAHITPEKAPSDGIRRGTNARIIYRIDLLMDEATAFHAKGTSAGASAGTREPEKGTSYIQTEISDRGQTTTPRSTSVPDEATAGQPESPTRKRDSTTSSGEPSRSGNGAGDGKGKRRQTWISPFWDPWKAKIGEPPGTLLRAVGDVKDANADDWKSGLVLESFLNFLEETDPKFLTDRAPLTWKAKWRAYTNNGEFYQRQVGDEARGLFG